VGLGLDDAGAGDEEELATAYRDAADVEGMGLKAAHRAI
jgi:hypothetical protein